MTAYLPSLHDLLGVVGLALTLVLFLALGSAATPRGTRPEFALAAGWGWACFALTAWGVLTPWPLTLPAAALGLAGVVWLARPGWRERISPWAPLGRIFLLMLPLWLVMLSVRPSQIDTWLNLLPNAGYLFDHNLLPTSHLPPSYSFLPVAPYNTQFAAYLASLASGSFAAAAMVWFNLALLGASGLLLARAVAATDTTPPWWACATGLLLAVPLNPGFVPRVFFAPYGEPSLAVTALFAVWLAADMLDDLARGRSWPGALAALPPVLAALVNIKQSGIGLLLPIAVSLLLLAWADPRIPRRRGLIVCALALLPSLLLYLLWRRFAVSSFIEGELQPLPFADWNIALLPQILLGMLVAAVQKATLFLCVAAVLAIAAVRMRRRPWSHQGHRLGLIAGTIVLFNGFLLFTYVAHFPPYDAVQAHSYFRYETQVSLLVMLGLTLALREFVARWLAQHRRPARYAAVVAVALLLAGPVAAAPLLRFDLDAPQPALWQLGHAAAAFVRPGDRLALLLPGDEDDSVGSLLRGVLLFTPPRRPGLDLRTETGAAPAALQAVAAAGYRLALVSCTPPGMAGVPAGVAALLRDTPDGWQPMQTWPWPEALRRQKFAALLARAPLCAAGVAG